MGRLFRGSLARRLFALGVLQLLLLIATAIAIGALTHPARPPHFPPPGGGPPAGEPPSGPPHGPPPEPFDQGPPGGHGPPGGILHHHLGHLIGHGIEPGLYPPLLTFACGLVIVGLGAWLTAGWFRRLLLSEKELLANVSHELRTPLARIRVALDLATEGDAETARVSLAEIATDLGELEVLVEDVLIATRIELAADGAPGALAMHRERIGASAIAERATQRFHSLHPDRRLEVQIAGADPDGFPSIEVDPMLFRRVLDNLLENAHKYSPDPTSPVSLEVRSEAAQVIFEVRDRGVGIPPSDLPHVFDPFFRGERSRDRRSGGVGLGLTLARRIVEAHGGRISIESRPESGTTARVALPL